MQPMLPAPEDVKRCIAQSLDCDLLQVEGDGRHFSALIVSAAFAGMSLVQRHQRVYAALGERMHAQVHALSMRTLTPAEYERGSR